MTRATIYSGMAILSVGMAAGALLAQQPSPTPQPFFVGNRLGLPINPAADGAFEAMSPNVKVYGAIYSAESCSYDPGRGVIVVPNRGVPQTVQTNNAWVSFINHDGSVHTARWIGVQNPGEPRSLLTPPLVLNEPYGSDIANGMLYVADRDGGTTPTEPRVAVIRKFNLQTGAPAGESPCRAFSLAQRHRGRRATARSTRRTPASAATARPRDLAGLEDHPRGHARPSSSRGRRCRQPNGIAFDPTGQHRRRQHRRRQRAHVRADAKLLKTEHAAQAGNDGLVIMPDGTKYVSSVVNGGVSRMRPGKPAELIAATSRTRPRCATTRGRTSW